MQPVIPIHPSVCHTDEPQLGQNSFLWLFHHIEGMIKEAIAISRSIVQSYHAAARLTRFHDQCHSLVLAKICSNYPNYNKLVESPAILPFPSIRYLHTQLYASCNTHVLVLVPVINHETAYNMTCS